MYGGNHGHRAGSKDDADMNQNGSNGEPYVNHLPGHPELDLVIPIREWDDAQAVGTVAAVRDNSRRIVETTNGRAYFLRRLKHRVTPKE